MIGPIIDNMRGVRVRAGQPNEGERRRSPARPLQAAARVTLLAALLAALLTGALAGLAPSATAVDELDLPGSLTTTQQSTVSMMIPVPDGIVPTAVRGRLQVGQDAREGRLVFRIGDRVSRDVPARSATPFDVPVRPTDLVGTSALDLHLTYTPTRACPNGTGPAAVTFGKLRLRFNGTPVTPTSVAGFFPDLSTRIDVVIPRQAPDDLIEAGLVAVASLSARYDEDTTIELSPAARVLPRAGLSQRVVRFVAGEGPVSAEVSEKFGLTTLTVTGSGAELSRAAQALGSDELALAGDASTIDLGQELPARDTSTVQSLADLGAPLLTVSGPGEATGSLAVAQDSFGGSVESFHVQVRATHSALPADTTSRLNTFFNGYLLDSQLLDDDLDVLIDATTPTTWLGADNTLSFTIDTVGPHTGCRDPRSIPVSLFVDGRGSTLTATLGPGRTSGFERFPQSFGGTLPVALRATGPDRVTAAVDAALVIGSLQRAAGAPIAVSLVDADEFLDSSRSGLLVGAFANDAEALGAPLLFDERRVVETTEGRFRVGTGQAFAALEAVSSGGRDVLVLGGWSPTADAAGLPSAQREAARQVAARGWPTTGDDLLVTGGAEKPFFLRSEQAGARPPTTTDSDRPGPWLVVGALLLAVLLVALVVVTLRRDRAAQPRTR